MSPLRLKVYFLSLSLSASLGFASGVDAQRRDFWRPEIPKTWVDADVASLEIPLADPASSPKHISADYYYRMSL